MSIAERRIAYLALGGNMGDRSAVLNAALLHINAIEETRVLRCSSLYDTEPWGVSEQADFLNTVAEVETALDALQLFRAIKSIESVMGRLETRRYGPRLIDIDLLLLDQTIVDDPVLTVPHPGIPTRRFVLVPLCELAPELVHPLLGKTMRELLAACEDTGQVRTCIE